MHLVGRLFDSLLFIFIIALAAGVLLPEVVGFATPLVSWLLAGIFFISSLKINIAKVVRELHRWKLVLGFMVIMLVVLPIIVYLVAKQLVPSLAIPFLLLAAMPAGMTSPFFAGLLGGRESLGLVLTVGSSLLAPLSVPIVLRLTTGTAINFSFWAMVGKIALLIIVPFILAQFAKRVWPQILPATRRYGQRVSMVFLAFLVAGVVAGQSATIIGGFASSGQTFGYVLAMAGFFVVLHMLGWLGFGWFQKREQVTATVCFVYMNFTLAIVIANEFFGDPKIVIPVVLSVVPWSLFVGIFKYVVSDRLHNYRITMSKKRNQTRI